jgi:hypothetical protein
MKRDEGQFIGFTVLDAFYNNNLNLYNNIGIFKIK